MTETPPDEIAAATTQANSASMSEASQKSSPASTQIRQANSVSMAEASEKSSSASAQELGIPEKYFCRLCGVNSVGYADVLQHVIGGEHTKKLKGSLGGQCTKCSATINDVKDVGAHVHYFNQKNKKRSGNPKGGGFLGESCQFQPCSMTFKCNVGQELHSVITHKVALSAEGLPGVTDLLKFLCGSSTVSPDDFNCPLCHKKLQELDDFVLHLLSIEHLQLLRASSCVLCNIKPFIHVSDRESHLQSAKHKNQIERACLSHKLEQVNKMAKEGAGFVCMYCMLWCKSWPCYILHLTVKDHQLISAGHEKYQSNKLNTENDEEVVALPPVNMRNGRMWLKSKSPAFCIVCSKSISNPQELESHLESHFFTSSALLKSNQFRLDVLSSQMENCHDLISCDFCSIVFKSSLALMVHKASKQHHIRRALFLNDGIICNCFKCSNVETEEYMQPANKMIAKPSNQSFSDFEKLKELDVNLPKSTKMLAHTDPTGNTNATIMQCDSEDPDKHVCSDFDTGISHNFDMIPVVVAAAVPVSTSLENSLQSAVQVVSKSLFQAVPKIRKCPMEEFTENKRAKSNSCDFLSSNCHRQHLSLILQEAVNEGLKSLTSFSSKAASVSGEGSKAAQILTGATCQKTESNTDKLAIVFAASVIQQSPAAEPSTQKVEKMECHSESLEKETTKDPMEDLFETLDGERTKDPCFKDSETVGPGQSKDSSISLHQQYQPPIPFSNYEAASSDSDVEPPKACMLDDVATDSDDTY